MGNRREHPGPIWDEAVVDARLRALAAYSASSPPPPSIVDMSLEAITARLSECAEISALALELAAAGEVV